jgi:hypothetical protein
MALRRGNYDPTIASVMDCRQSREMTVERKASCSCGKLAVACRGEPVRVSLCHCDACRARTGSAFSWNVTFAREQVVASGPASTYTRRADSGRSCTYYFCPLCGATVYYEIEARPGRVSVPAGGFAADQIPQPAIAVHAARKPSWLVFETEPPLIEE